MEALLKQLIKIFFVLQLVAKVFSLSVCSVNYFKDGWADDWSVLLTSNGENQYQLFRDQSVAANKDIIAVCNKRYQPITIGCKADERFSKTLPLEEKCQEKESLQPVRLTENASYCPYTLYKIGFNVEIGSDTHFHETYRVCFDKEHLRPLFAISKVYPVGGVRPRFLQFKPDDIFNGRHFSAFSRRASFERFKILLGNNQRHMSDHNLDHIIDRGHLTPSADFTLTNFKRSTFSMINVIPQFKTIDNGNCRLIEEWTRHRSRTPGQVCTGVLDCNLDAENTADLHCVVQLQDERGKWVPMFLADNRKIPIPLWSYKIVKNPQISLVFLTLNNIYHKGDVPLPSKICKQIECPLKLKQTVGDGRTFCCAYADFIGRNLRHLRGVC